MTIVDKHFPIAHSVVNQVDCYHKRAKHARVETTLRDTMKTEMSRFREDVQKSLWANRRTQCEW